MALTVPGETLTVSGEAVKTYNSSDWAERSFCGKCGAGLEAHLKAGTRMGILCCLTVEQGAIPGMSLGYDCKIRDLAQRAEIQKTMLEDKRERAERLAQAFPAFQGARYDQGNNGAAASDVAR